MSKQKCLENGKVFTAGRGQEGQLGQKISRTTKNVLVHRPEVENDEVAEDILCSYFTEVEGFGPEHRATMAACGEKFTLVLDGNYRYTQACSNVYIASDQVYSFGDTSDGCLGIDYDEKEQSVYKPRLVEKLVGVQVTTIEAGPRHAACITNSGELYCWGFNYYDQLEVVGETEKKYNV